MEVPKNVWKQMMYLCAQEPNKEWSGIMYYKSIGSVNDLPNFKVVAKDIFLKDIGTGVFTSYTTNTDEVEFMMENEQYMNMDSGKIHSHNTMNVFHSGTDWADLEDNSLTHNYYLSFIVNNRGDVEVKIAWRSKEKSEFKSHYYIKDNRGRLVKKQNSQSEDKDVLITADGVITIKKEGEPEVWFKERYEKVKKEISTRVVAPTTYYGSGGNWGNGGVASERGWKNGHRDWEYKEDETPKKQTWNYQTQKFEDVDAPTPVQKPLPFSETKKTTPGNFIASIMTMGASMSLQDAIEKVNDYKKDEFDQWSAAMFADGYWDDRYLKFFGYETVAETRSNLENLQRILILYKFSHPEVYEVMKNLVTTYLDKLDEEEKLEQMLGVD